MSYPFSSTFDKMSDFLNNRVFEKVIFLPKKFHFSKKPKYPSYHVTRLINSKIM